MNYYEKALQSWYKEGHPLRLDPLHPLLGMAGEVGELLNLYKKDKFKPNFSWWNCKHCGYGDASHDLSTKECPDNDDWDELRYYTPLVLDELGDIWYYMRIIAWQQNIELKVSDWDWQVLDILDLLTSLSYYSVGLLDKWQEIEAIAIQYLLNSYGVLVTLLSKLDYSLDQLTDLNYAKLNTADQNGWSSARG